MKPEVAERLFIESLFAKSVEEKAVQCENISNIERLTGDASTRRYYRVECSRDTYVVCIDNPSPDGKNTFTEFQRFFEKNNIRVPRIYHKNLLKGYILEEDLGDVTLLKRLSKLESEEEEYDVYKQIIDELLLIHNIPTDNQDTKTMLNLQFDFEKLINEIDFTIDYFVDKYLGIKDESYKRKILEEYYPICKRLSTEKMVCTHRDFHSRNIMCKKGENIVIDFQDARLGIPQYDLVSLLEDCYYDLTPSNREKLKKYYFENLDKRVHQQGSFEKFNELYNDMIMQRVFKAVGSFSYIFETRKDLRYLKYIGFAMEKMRVVMLGDEKYRSLKSLLYKVYYES